MTAPRDATSTRAGRTYTWPPTGERFPSVTTIIAGGVPKPALPRWAAKSVAEYATEHFDQLQGLDRCTCGRARQCASCLAMVDLLKGAPWRDSGAAADLGSAVHAAAEAFALGTPTPPPSPGVAPFLEQLAAFFAAFQPVLVASEATVYNRQLGYAGTLDALMRMDGDLVLVDIKTSRSGVYPEAALQLAAYANAQWIGLPDGTEQPMPHIDRGAVLHLRPDRWELVPVRIDQPVFLAFLAARDVWAFNDIAKECIGPPIRPRAEEAAL